VPSVAVVEVLAPGRTLVQIVGGTHDGELVVVMGGCRHPGVRTLDWYLDADDPPEPLPTREATARAATLLESLLSPQQLGDWRRDRCFWVPTPNGSVRLGRLYRLHFRPSGSGPDLLLCVVPAESAHLCSMPEADVWANLLLMLHADPGHFFEVANWRLASGGSWRHGPAPVPPTPAGRGPQRDRQPVTAAGVMGPAAQLE
jgi:hypothetical protein